MKNCISRFCLLALLLLMTIAPVRAEIVGQTTENEYIHRLIADNGQELCFVSGEKDPCLSYTDVNFDGINDAVILTQRGASNFVYQFFISDGEQYVLPAAYFLPRNTEISDTEKYVTVAASYLIVFVLWLVLRKKEALQRKRFEEDNKQH